MPKIECIIFDLDGVLTDTSVYHYLAWKRLADQIGVYFDEKINERLKGVSRNKSLEILLELSANEYSAAQKKALANIKNDYYKEIIDKICPDNLYPGVTELLEQINSCGIKTVLASASRNAKFIIEKLGIGNYFDYIVDADTIVNGKPDPEIFIQGAKHLNIPPQNCIVVEDSIAGLIGANAAQMLTIGIGGKELENYAAYVSESIEGINIGEILRKNYSQREKVEL